MSLKFAALLFLAALPALADTLFSPIDSTLKDQGVSIPNAHQVDANVYRGMLPVAFDQLKNQLLGNLKVTDVLILDERKSDNVVFEMETLSSKLAVAPAANYGTSDSSPAFQAQEKKFRSRALTVAGEKSPRRYYYRPLMWRDLKPFDRNCREYVDALRILEAIHRAPNRKVYFHCTVGEDRTGAVAGLYRLLKDPKADLAAVFHDEMCARGYEAGDQRKSAPIVQIIRENLTPFFLKMAYLVKSGALTAANLDYRACETDPATQVDFAKSDAYQLNKFECAR